MRRKHGVVAGASWGTLPAELQVRWQRIACDALALPARPVGD